MKPKIPLVYSCSGASSAAQMTNHIAVKMDRLKVAQMSCIAGVGGDVKPLVRTAKSDRPLIALDGCPLHCVAHILKRHGVEAAKHYDLSKMGASKRMHEDFDPQEAARVLHGILADLELPGEPPPDDDQPSFNPVPENKPSEAPVNSASAQPPESLPKKT